MFPLFACAVLAFYVILVSGARRVLALVTRVLHGRHSGETQCRGGASSQSCFCRSHGAMRVIAAAQKMGLS